MSNLKNFRLSAEYIFQYYNLSNMRASYYPDFLNIKDVAFVHPNVCHFANFDGLLGPKVNSFYYLLLKVLKNGCP